MMKPDPHSEPASVEVTGLVKRYGGHTALGGVSFSVRPGELFGVIGPDGAGKTTLIRILVTVLTPDEGTATVDGLDVVTAFREIRKRVGYMPGRFSLYGDLSVEENLRFFATVFGTTIEEGYDLIAPIYSQIEPFKQRRAGALSGGMKQKLALSCALVHRPRVLFLDEPTTGVDAVSRREFWDMLARLKANGLTILVSTPYMDEAARCDRVALVQRGRLLHEPAPPGAIVRAYEGPLLSVRARDRHRVLRALRDLPYARSAHAFGETVHYTDARTDTDPAVLAREIESRLAAAGFSDVTAVPTRPTIEDAFMALMGDPDATEPTENPAHVS